MKMKLGTNGQVAEIRCPQCNTPPALNMLDSTRGCDVYAKYCTECGTKIELIVMKGHNVIQR